MVRSWAGESEGDAQAYKASASGLLEYLDEHARAEDEGRGRQYRKTILLQQGDRGAEKGATLRDCSSGANALSVEFCRSREILLYHMLRRIGGDDAFFDAVRRLIGEYPYPMMSWDVVASSFRTTFGENMEWFFRQWLERPGTIEFDVREMRVVVREGRRTVTFDIVQKGTPYRFDLPIRIATDRGDVLRTVLIEKEKTTCEIPVEGNPVEIVFDGGYDLFRTLFPEEVPPRIGTFLRDEKKLVVLPPSAEKNYEALIGALKMSGVLFKEESAVRDDDIRSHSLLVFGTENRIVKRLFGRLDDAIDGFALEARKNPLNESKVILVAQAASAADVPQTNILATVAGYSLARFTSGRLAETHIHDSSQGKRIRLAKPILTVQPGKLRTLKEDIEAIVTKSIVYVGERHANYEDHKTQLEIIMTLHESGRPFAIGMEMFQKPFQKEIDDYLAGVLDERQFLKRTQYFKRWTFDYNHYREIVDFAKAKKIPIIALNIRTEIIRKVSASGLDSLSDDERAELPPSMDMSDRVYRERLEEVFRQHKHHEARNFEYFYQSQVLWDESMAHAIDDFLKRNPEHQMVVLAGAGHLMYGSGIPKRVFRLNKRDYVIVLPGADVVDANVGDYLVAAAPASPPTTLKLGVVLKERNGRVEVKRVVPGSIAKSIGIQTGDVILALDDWNVEEIDDVTIFMSDKRRGEPIRVTVSRKRFLFGSREVVLSGTI